MIKVYHNPEFLNYSSSKSSIDMNQLIHVATLDVSSLEDAYIATQNTDEPWQPETFARSTSVGDVMEKDQQFYVVDNCGFEPLKEVRNV